jgi:uncharacterized Zn finger protein (UPF0148 family)
MIVTCPKCQRNVFPKSDQSCPSCGGSLTGVRAAPEPTERERELARLSQIYVAELAHQHAVAEKTRSRGVNLLASGVLVMLLAALATFLSYRAADSDGHYSVWLGGIFGGVLMIGRGWMHLHEARRLRAG